VLQKEAVNKNYRKMKLAQESKNERYVGKTNRTFFIVFHLNKMRNTSNFQDIQTEVWNHIES